MTDDIKPAGSCKHRPTSNGWSGGSGFPSYAWCGHCKSLVFIDVVWCEKFEAAGKTSPRAIGYEVSE